MICLTFWLSSWPIPILTFVVVTLPLFFALTQPSVHTLLVEDWTR